VFTTLSRILERVEIHLEPGARRHSPTSIARSACAARTLTCDPVASNLQRIHRHANTLLLRSFVGPAIGLPLRKPIRLIPTENLLFVHRQEKIQFDTTCIGEATLTRQPCTFGDRRPPPAATAPRRRSFIRPLLAALLLSATAGAATQIPTPSPAAAPGTAAPTQPVTPPPTPSDPLGRTTPEGCVLGFLRTAEQQDYEHAAKYLDTKLPAPQAEQLAMQLKALLDFGSTSDLKALSRVPEGDLDDNLRSTRERVAIIETRAGPLDVLLDRVHRPGEDPIWLFSPQTLNQVPAAYATINHRDLSEHFPRWMSRIRLLSMPLWRWSLILTTLAVVALGALILARLILWLLKATLHGRVTPHNESAILKLRWPVIALIAGVAEHAASGYSITALGRRYWEIGSLCTILLSLAWLLMQLSDVFASFASDRLTVRNQIERVTVVGLLVRLFKILVGVIVFVALLTELGVNVSELVAGLGIGGIALALAAQKTLADLFGGIALVMRGVVRVGDYCSLPAGTGTVEEIGISALRLRTLDRSIVSIPNGKVAELQLENLSMRDRFWIHQVFTLRFDTPLVVVKQVCANILTVLKSRPHIDKFSARIRVLKLTPAGPQLEVFAYFQRPGADVPAFLEEQEAVIFEIMRLIEEAGTSMAAPVGIVDLKPEP
jgi:MscS family membrane protein